MTDIIADGQFPISGISDYYYDIIKEELGREPERIRCFTGSNGFKVFEVNNNIIFLFCGVKNQPFKLYKKEKWIDKKEWQDERGG